MKKIYVLLLSAFSFIMLSGCNDWIELEPKDTVANENFFKTKDDFDQAVTGLYSMLRPLDDEAKDGAYFGNLYWEVCADVCMYKNSWTQPWFDISRGELKSVTDNVASLYQKVYAAISWSNTIIEQIEAKQSEFPEDFVNYVKGQAHFVRAICYIRLTSLWGPVPMIDRLYLPSESKLPRSSVDDITNQLIIPDLKIAVSCLEMTPYNTISFMTYKASGPFKLYSDFGIDDTVQGTGEWVQYNYQTGLLKAGDKFKMVIDSREDDDILYVDNLSIEYAKE